MNEDNLGNIGNIFKVFGNNIRGETKTLTYYSFIGNSSGGGGGYCSTY